MRTWNCVEPHPCYCRECVDKLRARVAELEKALEDIRRIARTPPRSVADETVTEITDAALAKKGGG